MKRQHSCCSQLSPGSCQLSRISRSALSSDDSSLSLFPISPITNLCREENLPNAISYAHLFSVLSLSFPCQVAQHHTSHTFDVFILCVVQRLALSSLAASFQDINVTAMIISPLSLLLRLHISHSARCGLLLLHLSRSYSSLTRSVGWRRA